MTSDLEAVLRDADSRVTAACDAPERMPWHRGTRDSAPDWRAVMREQIERVSDALRVAMGPPKPPPFPPRPTLSTLISNIKKHWETK